MKKNTRTVSKCPDAVQKLFDAANAYEYGQSLPPLERAQRDLAIEEYNRKELSESEFNDRYSTAVDYDFSVWLNSLKDDPQVRSYDALKDFLLEHAQTMDPNYSSKAGAIEDFDTLRGLLTSIVEHVEDDRVALEKNPDSPTFETWRYLNNIPVRMLISPSKAGREIGLSLHPLYEPIIGCDLRRFRQCPVCKGFFWAERLEKEGCSNHNVLIRKWRKKLNDSADRFDAVERKLEIERSKTRPNPALVKKYQAELTKLTKIFKKYISSRKRTWFPKA